MDDNLITMDSDDDDEIFDSDEDIFDETVDVMNARLSLTKSTRGFRVCQELSDEEIDQDTNGYSKCSKLWKHKKDMTIQDVVKEQVLCLLPAKALCRCKSVCKEWNQWITRPFLAHLQSYSFRDISGLFCQIPYTIKPFFISLNHSASGVPTPTLSFLPEDVKVCATCNGLLCCKSHVSFDTKYYICNPANKEWMVLPKPELYHGLNSAVVLAFEPTADNVKAHFQLICAVPLIDTPVVYFEIYSSRSNSWRAAKTECWEPDALVLNDDGFFLNGVALWETSHSDQVLAFQLKDEQYGTLPLPQRKGSKGALSAIHGELCYILPHEEENEVTMEIYGGLNMSLKYNIPLSPEACSEVGGKELRALPCVNEDLLTLLVGNKMCAYHVKEGKLEIIRNVYTQDGRFLPYVNSLVSVGQQLVENDEYSGI